jgi:hypothetical protein
MKRRRLSMLGLALILALASCGRTPAPTPDLVATEVALQQAVAATLTAAAPTPTVPPPSDTPTVPPPSDTPASPPPSDTPPPLPTHTATEAPTVAPTHTATARPTPRPSATPQPTASPLPVAWKAEPYAVVGVVSDDVLNVRSGPGVGYRVVTTIPFNGLGVQVGEPGQRVDGSLWVPVRYGGVSGWANSRFLARQVGSADGAAVARAAQIILALRDRQMTRLAAWVHPEQGVRFSPYAYVTAGDQVFSADELPGLFADPTVRLWGAFDGTGDPIELTFAEYYRRFVYDVDFAEPEVLGLNERVGLGNSLDNIADFYPGAVFVEYHFSGFEPQYGGMDWRSLRLVLVQRGGTWYLVGLVHDEWTI